MWIAAGDEMEVDLSEKGLSANVISAPIDPFGHRLPGALSPVTMKHAVCGKIFRGATRLLRQSKPLP